jgi:hypothetical protein
VEAVAFWHVLGLWKLALIIEGVRRRALGDPRNAPAARVPPQRTVDDLAAQAQLVSLKAGL